MVDWHLAGARISSESHEPRSDIDALFEADVTAPSTRLRHRLAIAIGGVGGTKVLGALGGVLAARLLGPSGKGEQAALVLLGMVLGQMAGLGVEYWIQREVAISGHSSSSLIRTIRRQVLLGVGLVVAACALGLALGAPPVDALAVAVYAATWVVSMSWLAVSVGLHDSVRVNAASVLGALAYLTAVVVLIVADQPEVAAVVGAAGIGSAVVAAVAGSPSRRLALDRAEPAEGEARLGEAIRFGWPNAAGELLTIALARFDVVLVLALAGPSEAGLYAVASSYAELLWVLPAAASQILLPQVAWRGSTESTEALGRLSVMVMVPLGILAAVSAQFVVPTLFGADFAGAVEAVPLLCVAAVGLGLWRIIVSDLVGRGRSRIRFSSAAVGLVVMVVADLLLVPTAGIAGAAGGSALGYIAALAVSGRVWSSSTGHPIRRLMVGRIPRLRRATGERP